MPEPALPITEILPALGRTLRATTRAVVVAPPGAGKTTLVPLALRDAPWRAGGRILMLEPRRLATRAAARRMAELLGESVGETVGYQTREERHIGPRTEVEVVTEGILTRRLQNDPTLTGVAVVIFDEVHERNLPTDLGLALTLDAAATVRPDLRILAMSATADLTRLPDLLATGAGPAPVLSCDGRTHPVEMRWLPRTRTQRLEGAVVAAVQTALRENEGDVLVFLPGIGEIRRIAGDLAAVLPDHVDVHPLAGTISLAEQDRALAPSAVGRRRVVLSTDIAETSLTVEGVRIVIDAGLARAPRFDAATGMTRLTTITTSRSSADQRAGRAGRTAPGVCYRLWSRIEHTSRPAQPRAEITEVDLAGLLLEVAAWGTPLEELSWMDPPPAGAVRAGTEVLRDLGALAPDPGGRTELTDLGRQMLGLPVHPRLARMIATHPTPLACALAALIEDRDPLRSAERRDIPADLALRLMLIAGHGGFALDGVQVDRGLVERLARSAREIAARAHIDWDPTAIDTDRAGEMLLAAYPDRVAGRRRPGQFQLRGGQMAMLADTDPLATAEFLVAADLDGRRDRGRIRLAAAVDAEAVSALYADEIETRRTLDWDRGTGELVETVERRLGGLRLGERTGPATPSPEVTSRWIQRIRATDGEALAWTPAARDLTARATFLHRHLGMPWPDWSRPTLMADLEDWLGPFLAPLARRSEIEALDLVMILRARLPWEVGHELDTLAPATWRAHDRDLRIDYHHEIPEVHARVQDLFGITAHPQVAGVPLRLQLLSPADRPIQITTDLPGFWAGSWAAVRAEMAGRYPKHQWPLDPATATPRRLKDR